MDTMITTLKKDGAKTPVPLWTVPLCVEHTVHFVSFYGEELAVAGNPARIVATTDEYIERNAASNLHCKDLSHSAKKRFLLSLDDSQFIHKPFMASKH